MLFQADKISEYIGRPSSIILENHNKNSEEDLNNIPAGFTFTYHMYPK